MGPRQVTINLASHPPDHPLALAFGRGAPAIIAARTLPHWSDRARVGGGDLIERARVAEALGFPIGEVHSDWTPHFAPARFISDKAHYPELEGVTFDRLAPQYALLEAAMDGARWMLFGRRTIGDAYLYMLARTADLMP